MDVKFKKFDCTIETGMYQQGNTAIKLIGVDLPIYDNLVAVATTNLPGLAKDEVAIKDWSENEGMYQTLLGADIIKPAHRYEASGWIEAIPICYLKSEL
jgi:hypothetical protein